MRKVKLVLDDLEVETFAVNSDLAETRGTVEGLAEVKESGVDTNCYSDSAGDSCGYTEYSCFWDCGVWSDV